MITGIDRGRKRPHKNTRIQKTHCGEGNGFSLNPALSQGSGMSEGQVREKLFGGRTKKKGCPKILEQSARHGYEFIVYLEQYEVVYGNLRDVSLSLIPVS